MACGAPVRGGLAIEFRALALCSFAGETPAM
jgi:hypothetical protein